MFEVQEPKDVQVAVITKRPMLDILNLIFARNLRNTPWKTVLVLGRVIIRSL
jgi:hypothetical protein